MKTSCQNIKAERAMYKNSKKLSRNPKWVTTHQLVTGAIKIF